MTKSKFAGIFQQQLQASVVEAKTQEPPLGRIEKAIPESRTARAVGRPPGKRSDPEWKQFSVLLRKRTQREATTILRSEQGDDGARDLSDLVQELLERWVEERRRS